MKFIEYLPDAINDLREAILWYEQRESGIGERLMQELLRAESFVALNPGAGAPYLCNTQKWPLHVFPYIFVYREESERIVVIAVAHTSRRPGYWASRLQE